MPPHGKNEGFNIEETSKKAGLNKEMKSKAKFTSAQVFCIQPGNDVGEQELKALKCNIALITNYFRSNFEQ
jgi:hypothetical protein